MSLENVGVSCLFRLRGRPLKNGEGWVLRVLCGSHNHDVVETLVGLPNVGWLTINEKKCLLI